MGRARNRKLAARAKRQRVKITDEHVGLEAWRTTCEAAQGQLPDAQVYAMRKTGCMISVGNQHHYSAEQIAAWRAAVDEFNAKANP